MPWVEAVERRFVPTCVRCGGALVGLRRRFCSGTCSTTYRTHHRATERAQRAAYAAENPRKCDECGKPMRRRGPHHCYCSTACRMRVYRRRKRAPEGT